jgi:hypothetical protein
MWLPAPPEFSGSDAEDPELFIEDCEATFPPSFDERQKVRAASWNLRGDAARWWAEYNGFPIAWGLFKGHLRRKYSDESLLASLRSKLYGGVLSHDEDVTTFLERRHQLALRLLLREKEESIVRTLLETIHPSIRCYLQTGTFETMADLILRTERVQDNIEAMRREEARPTRGPQKALERQAQRAIAPTADSSRRGAARFPSKGRADEARPYDRHPREAPQLPRCRFCPERHWHRDCLKARTNPGNSATENFVHTHILSADTTLRPHTNSHVLLAGEGQQMKVDGMCDL